MQGAKTIAFTGGGTAGHVYPAFPVLERLQNAGYTVFWIGSISGMERSLVEKLGIAYYGIPTGKLRRYWAWKNFLDFFRIFTGILHSWTILCKQKPLALFSKGGFVSVPAVAAARILNIPSFTHESDVDPGLATRLNLKLGARAFVSYEKTLTFLSASARVQACITGNPVRDSIFRGNRVSGRQIACISPEDNRPLLLVMGGSQGAGEINTLITDVLDDLLADAVIVHQTGADCKERLDPRGYISRQFFSEEIPDLLAAAELVVSRSGAGALWEMAASRTPAIFIPLRKATRGDQLRNAEAGADAGLSVTLAEGASAEDLLCLIRALLHDAEQLKKMIAAADSFPVAQAANLITSAILKDLR